MSNGLMRRLKRDVPGTQGGGDPGNPHNFVGGPSAQPPGTSQVFAEEGQVFTNSEAKGATFSPLQARNPHLFVTDPQKNGGHDGGEGAKIGQDAPLVSESLGGPREKVGHFQGAAEKKQAISPPPVGAISTASGEQGEDVPMVFPGGTDMWEAALALQQKHLKVEALLASGAILGPKAWEAYSERVLKPLYALQDRMPNHQVWELNNYLEPWRGGPGFESALRAWEGLGGRKPGARAFPLIPVLTGSFSYKEIRRLWSSVQKLAYAQTDSARRAHGSALKALLSEILRNPSPTPGLLEKIDQGDLPGFEREVLYP